MQPIQSGAKLAKPCGGMAFQRDVDSSHVVMQCLFTVEQGDDFERGWPGRIGKSFTDDVVPNFRQRLAFVQDAWEQVLGIIVVRNLPSPMEVNFNSGYAYTSVSGAYS